MNKAGIKDIKKQGIFDSGFTIKKEVKLIGNYRLRPDRQKINFTRRKT